MPRRHLDRASLGCLSSRLLLTLALVGCADVRPDGPSSADDSAAQLLEPASSNSWRDIASTAVNASLILGAYELADGDSAEHGELLQALSALEADEADIAATPIADLPDAILLAIDEDDGVQLFDLDHPPGGGVQGQYQISAAVVGGLGLRLGDCEPSAELQPDTSNLLAEDDLDDTVVHEAETPIFDGPCRTVDWDNWLGIKR